MKVKVYHWKKISKITKWLVRLRKKRDKLPTWDMKEEMAPDAMGMKEDRKGMLWRILCQ